MVGTEVCQQVTGKVARVGSLKRGQRAGGGTNHSTLKAHPQ